MGRGIERKKIFLMASSIQKILAGYVVNFNKRHRRYGQYNISIGELRSGGRRRALAQVRRAMS